MTNIEHKHKEILLALASGADIRDFECKSNSWDEWESLIGYSNWISDPEYWEVRRKVSYILVNGFKVPKPLTNMLKTDGVYTPHISRIELYEFNSVWASLAVKRKIAHDNKEAAVIHAKALLGIDPYA